MKTLNPLELLMWTFRRNERDVINLYNYLSDVMRLATGGDMLNFGYWDGADTPVLAQDDLCDVFARKAMLESGQMIADIGSGYGAPAARWCGTHSTVDVICVNINRMQLCESKGRANTRPVNATATSLPFGRRTFDRVLAFESAQHFRPLGRFISESHRILKDDGLFALAIPVMAQELLIPHAKLGLLSVTWSSEHYSKGHIISALEEKFGNVRCESVGRRVYGPLADYYNGHRAEIRRRLSGQYPRYVEKILSMSVNKMKAISQDGTIDYLLIVCRK